EDLTAAMVGDSTAGVCSSREGTAGSRGSDPPHTGAVMRRFTRLRGAIALCLAAGLPAAVGGQGGIASAPAKFLAPATQVVAIRAGRLFDSRSGTLTANQTILI